MTVQFRDENIDKIGRGTRFKTGNFDEFLIIQDNVINNPNKIRLLNMNTSRLAGSSIKVENPDWITDNEFRKLIDFMNVAVSDCSFKNGSDPIKY